MSQHVNASERLSRNHHRHPATRPGHKTPNTLTMVSTRPTRGASRSAQPACEHQQTPRILIRGAFMRDITRPEVWAPDADMVEVVVDDTGTIMARSDGGWWWSEPLPPGTLYQFRIDDATRPVRAFGLAEAPGVGEQHPAIDSELVQRSGRQRFRPPPATIAARHDRLGAIDDDLHHVGVGGPHLGTGDVSHECSSDQDSGWLLALTRWFRISRPDGRAGRRAGCRGCRPVAWRRPGIRVRPGRRGTAGWAAPVPRRPSPPRSAPTAPAWRP